MKRFIFFLVVAFVVVSCIKIKTTKTEVEQVSEVRNLKDFKVIVVEGSPTVRYKQDSVWSVKVYASAEELKNVKTEVKDGKLLVAYNNNIIVKPDFTLKIDDMTIVSSCIDVEVIVSSPDLIGVGLHGSGDFVAMSDIDTDKLQTHLSGSGSLEFNNILCDTISTLLEGSGDISMSNVDAFSSAVSLIGSGDIKLHQKNVLNTNIQLKGSGDIFIDFDNCDHVNSTLKGSGDIRLAGTVRSLSKESLGSGDYELAGLRIIK